MLIHMANAWIQTRLQVKLDEITYSGTFVLYIVHHFWGAFTGRVIFLPMSYIGHSYCNGLFSFQCNLRRFQRISPWKRSFPEREMTAALLPSASTMPSSAGNFLRGLSNRLMIPFWRIHKLSCWITVWGQHSRNSTQKDAGSSHWSLRLCFSSFSKNWDMFSCLWLKGLCMNEFELTTVVHQCTKMLDSRLHENPN